MELQKESTSITSETVSTTTTPSATTVSTSPTTTVQTVTSIAKTYNKETVLHSLDELKQAVRTLVPDEPYNYDFPEDLSKTNIDTALRSLHKNFVVNKFSFDRMKTIGKSIQLQTAFVASPDLYLLILKDYSLAVEEQDRRVGVLYRDNIFVPLLNRARDPLYARIQAQCAKLLCNQDATEKDDHFLKGNIFELLREYYGTTDTTAIKNDYSATIPVVGFPPMAYGYFPGQYLPSYAGQYSYQPYFSAKTTTMFRVTNVLHMAAFPKGTTAEEIQYKVRDLSGMWPRVQVRKNSSTDRDYRYDIAFAHFNSAEDAKKFQKDHDNFVHRGRKINVDFSTKHM